ncbi:hypothetical protein A9970_06635 [Sphingobacterium sp. UME9]|nr:hypothetical protein [Sphingobacterium sp. UME9]
MGKQKDPETEMKTEKIITTWMTDSLMLFNVVHQIQYETIKTAVICITSIFTIIIFIWLICKKNKRDETQN